MGTGMPDQGGGKVAHLAGSAGQHSHLHPHLRRQAQRCQGTGPAGARARRLLASRDRGYFDFARLYRLHSGAAFFLIRAKSDTQVRRQYSRAVDRSTGLRCDQTIRPSGKHSPRLYPEQLRRIKYYDAETDKTFVFLTNNFELPALTIAELYRYRWRVELFFKWIKQHLRIKTFFGSSENAVKTQVWIAVGVYVLVAIIKKRLDIPESLYTMLQILSLTLFERTPLNQLLTGTSELDYKNHGGEVGKQLNLFH
jgi:hypothetical protein